MSRQCHREMERVPGATCAHCREQIGEYEPIIAIDYGHTQRTSLIAAPELRGSNMILLHEHCARHYQPPPAVD